MHHNEEYLEGKQSYYMNITSFSDISHQEFVDRFLTYRSLPIELVERQGQQTDSTETNTVEKSIGDAKRSHVFSYFAKGFVNLTYEEVETKYSAKVLAHSADGKDIALPREIDWRQQVCLVT